MFIIILGVLALAIGYGVAKSNTPLRNFHKLIKGLGVGLIAIGILTISVVQIEPGEVGVQKLFGKVSDNILQSGLNLKNPLVEVVPFNVKTQNYTMSAVAAEGEVQGDDAIRVLSADGLEVVIDLTVLYKVVSTRRRASCVKSARTIRILWYGLYAAPRSGIMPCIMTPFPCILQKGMNSRPVSLKALNQISKTAGCCSNSCLSAISPCPNQ